MKTIALVALLAPHVWSAPLTVSIAEDGFAVSDNGAGDLNALDGVLAFDHVFSDPIIGSRRFSGTAVYVEGRPRAGPGGSPGRSGFGVSFTEFEMTSLSGPTGPPPNNGRIVLSVQGVFSPGIAATDFGRVVTSLDGFTTTDINCICGSDFGTWDGVPGVFSGHVIANHNPNPGVVTRLPVGHPPDIGRLASGVQDSEIVTLQLITLYLPPDDLGKLELGNTSALVFVVPEPGSALLLGIGLVALCGIAVTAQPSRRIGWRPRAATTVSPRRCLDVLVYSAPPGLTRGKHVTRSSAIGEPISSGPTSTLRH